MTREEQIIKASQRYAKHQQKPFMDGALWADAHPTDEVLKLRKMFESDPDAYKQGYKDAIDKVWKWLENIFHDRSHHSGRGDAGEIVTYDFDSMQEFELKFRKAIEE